MSLLAFRDANPWIILSNPNFPAISELMLSTARPQRHPCFMVDQMLDFMSFNFEKLLSTSTVMRRVRHTAYLHIMILHILPLFIYIFKISFSQICSLIGKLNLSWCASRPAWCWAAAAPAPPAHSAGWTSGTLPLLDWDMSCKCHYFEYLCRYCQQTIWNNNICGTRSTLSECPLRPC